VSGSSLALDGNLVSLSREDWHSRWRQLWFAQPGLLECDISRESLGVWHDRKATRDEEDNQWEAALWHLGRMAKLKFEVPRERVDRLRRFQRAWRFAPTVREVHSLETYPAPTDEERRAITKEALTAPLWVAPGPFVDFAYFLPERTDYVAGYVAREIVTDASCVVRILLGSNDGVRLWMDDTPVFDFVRARYAIPDEDTKEVPLSPGRHVLLIEVSQTERAWGLYFRIEDLQGRSLTLTDSGRLEALHIR
jgi:hypothetical protein